MYQVEANSLLDSLCMIAVYVIAIYNYSCVKRGKNGSGFVLFTVFILLFSLFYRPLGGDFWHYLDSYQLGYDFPYHHMEEYYYWLMRLIPDNYLLWRVAIWFPAAIIVTMIFKMLRVSSALATFFFLLIALLPSFYYTRNVLGLSVLYLGLAIYTTSQNGVHATRLFNTLLLGGLVLVSGFLHKSMPMYIAFAIVSLILPFNKKFLIVALIAFPLLYGSVMLISTRFINMTDLWLLEGTGENYLETTNLFSSNWKGVVSYLISYLPIVYFYVIAFRQPLSSDNPDYKSYKVFLIFSFLVFFVSCLFFGHGAEAIQGRIYKSSMLPFSIVACLYFKDNVKTKRCNYFILLLAASLIWRTLVTGTV